MNFHLQFPIPVFPQKINYTHSSLFIGSCFAENIGGLMQKNKFDTLINPHGILYNPSSIAVALRRYINSESVTDDALFLSNDLWNSWEHHSRFSNTDKPQCLSDINDSIQKAHEQLKEAEWLFITFGSAFVYEKSGNVVGNCHKLPQKEFSKRILETSEIVEEYKELISSLKFFNPSIKIVFTISPVRYVRDGVVENNLSKARLVDAVHKLTEENIFYFPAYELMMDDLRDYRFYTEDLVHPTEQAIQYIFQKLKEASFDAETAVLFEKVKEVITASEHRSFNSTADSHIKFKASQLAKCCDLQKQYPTLDLSKEIAFFS